jgi:arylsulfatase A-like enzyme
MDDGVKFNGRAAGRFALLAAAVGFASVGIAMIADGQSAPVERPSVLLITLDTTRADALGCYGAKGDPTPHLDRLAARGVRFENAFAPCPITLPSHTTMLTGLYPPEHGLRDNSPRALPSSVPVVTEAFKDEGYHTAAFVSAEPLARKWGLARGFRLYNDALDQRPSPLTPRERRGDDTTRIARLWLKAMAKSKKPFFLWVHLFDPHLPYAAPSSFRKRFPESPYAAEVAFMDDCIGDLLDALEEEGRLGSTAVLVAGDHGESLGEHGEPTHAHLIYGSTLRVPLICTWPSHWRDRGVVNQPVGLVDLAPTLYHLLGRVPPPHSGQSLLDVLAGKREEPDPRPLYAESLYDFLHFGWAPLYSVRAGSRHLIQADGNYELYDLESDPGESKDLVSDRPADLRPLKIRLARLRASLTEPPPSASGVLDAPPGYLQAPHAQPTLQKDADREGKRRIPMKAIGDVPTFEHVKNLSFRNDLKELSEAESRLAGLLEKDPDNPSYRYWAGRIQLARMRVLERTGGGSETVVKAVVEARECFTRTLNRRPSHAGAQNLLFYCLIMLDEPEPVIQGAATIIGQGYENRDTRLWLANAYLTRDEVGDLALADRENREGLKRFPDNPRLKKQREVIDRLLLKRQVDGRKREKAEKKGDLR